MKALNIVNGIAWILYIVFPGIMLIISFIAFFVGFLDLIFGGNGSDFFLPFLGEFLTSLFQVGVCVFVAILSFGQVSKKSATCITLGMVGAIVNFFAALFLHMQNRSFDVITIVGVVFGLILIGTQALMTILNSCRKKAIC